MKESVVVQFKDLNFVVEGYYFKRSQTWFEIEAIFVDDSDTNIKRIFSEEDLQEFEESAISIIE